ADLVAEVDVAGRVDQVDDVAVPLEPHVLGLDRDAALALEVHRVEVLRAHVARVDGARQLEEPVGERRLPVVDMGDDADAEDRVERRHNLRILADAPTRPGTDTVLPWFGWWLSGRPTSISCGTGRGCPDPARRSPTGRSCRSSAGRARTRPR